MSTNEIVAAVAEEIGRVAKQSAENVLNSAEGQQILRNAARSSETDVQRAFNSNPVPNTTGARTNFENSVTLPEARAAGQRTGNVATSRPGLPARTTPIDRTPRISNAFSRNTNNRETFEDFVPPGETESVEQVENELRAQEASERQLRDDFQRALQDGPAALRHRRVAAVNLIIPVSTGAIQTESDGIVPEKTEQGPIRVQRLYVADNGFVFPRGEIIEDRNQFDLTGDLAVETIDASVVNTTATTSDSENGFNISSTWALAIVFGVSLILLILYAVNKALQKRSKVVVDAENVDLNIEEAESVDLDLEEQEGQNRKETTANVQ